MTAAPGNDASNVPALTSAGAAPFWAATVLTGVGSGIAAALLLKLLDAVQHWAWPGPHILEAAAHAAPARHVLVLSAAGVVTGLGQLVLRRVSSGNSIDITKALARHGGRLPALRTLGSALLSMVVVGLLAATTRGPISSVMPVLELTGRDRSFILPLLPAVVAATLVARTLDERSIYDARFSDREVDEHRVRKPASA